MFLVCNYKRFNLVTGPALQSMIDFLLLVVKKVILWPNPGHPFSSVPAETRYHLVLSCEQIVAIELTIICCLSGSYDLK